MAFTHNVYLAGSTIATASFASFFNEIKEIFINMGHTYISDLSNDYKHVFTLNPDKYIFCGCEATLTITISQELYDAYLSGDTSTLEATATAYQYLYYTVSLNNGFSRTIPLKFRDANTSSSFLDSTEARYQTFREIQTDNIYHIMVYSGNIQYSSNNIFTGIWNSSGYYTYASISSCKFFNFNTGLEDDITYLFNNPYITENMLPCTLYEPNISSVSSAKVLTSPLWVANGTQIDGYIKDILVSSTIEPYSKYKINNVSYIPMDRSQHYLIKE